MSESKQVYNLIKNGQQLVGVLIDPEKFIHQEKAIQFINQLNAAVADIVLVGGSFCTLEELEFTLNLIAHHCSLPILLFPGSHVQVSDRASAILFMSLLSGRNPDFLIGHQLEAAEKLHTSRLEVIPTAYLLLEGGKVSSVEKYSGTQPIPQDKLDIIFNTVLAGKLLGHKLTYLDAGSGALNRIKPTIIRKVSKIGTPLIVGGGIRTLTEIKEAHDSGANLVVIGSKLEETPSFLSELKKYRLPK